MFFLLEPDDRLIVAGTATLTLSVEPGTSVAPSLTIVAGTATLRLLPDTASVTITPVAVSVIESASDQLAAAVREAHEPRSRLITLSGTRARLSTYNPATITLSGSVTYDRRREVRRAASLTVVDETGALAPTAYGDEFAQGELVQVDRGVRLDGRTIYELLGVFEVRSFESSLDGTLSLRAEDPATALRQDVGEVVILGAGTAAEDALRTLWEPVLGDGSSWDLDGGQMALSEPRTINEDDERLHVAVTLMADLGLEVSMSRPGYPVLRPLTDPNTDPIARTYRQRAGEALATRLARRGDRQPYNRQVVIGESPGAPAVRAVADITDPTSPIHRDRIGLRVAPIHRSAQITTQHQANAVARSLLIERSMWSDTVIWVGVPDPTLEAGAIVRVVDQQTATDARYRVDRVTIPVALGSMSLEASRVLPLFEAAA